MIDVSITIKFKDTELTLSVDAARELHGILGKLLFGVKASSEVDKFSLDDLKRLLEKEMPKIAPIPQPYPCALSCLSATASKTLLGDYLARR